MIRAAPHHYEPAHPEVAMKQKVRYFIQSCFDCVCTLRFVKTFLIFQFDWNKKKKKKKKKRNEFVRINFYIHFAQHLIRWQKRYFNVSWDRMKFQRFGPLYSQVAFAFVTSTIRLFSKIYSSHTSNKIHLNSVYILNPWIRGSPRNFLCIIYSETNIN